MTESFDAFGRLRVSDTGQRLDVEFLYDKQVEYFDETTNNGTVTYNGNSRDLTLSLGDANNGSYAKMASYPVPYTPGNSQLIEITGVLDLAGIGGGTLEVFRRTSTSGSIVTEEVIPQSKWAALTDSSSLRPDMAHIFVIDFQSLKVGRVRFGIAQHGKYHFIGKMDNDNERNVGYWQLANGSCYWHLYTAGGITYMEVGYGNDNNAIGFRYRITANASATMKAICCTTKSEGGRSLLDQPGLPRAISTGITEQTVSTVLYPVLSIRPKSTFKTYENLVLALPKKISVQTDQPTEFRIVVGGTLTNEVWADVDATHSSMEYDVTASAISGGRVIDSFYLNSAIANRGSASEGLLGKTVLWDRQSSETGILTVAAIKTATSDADVLAAIEWEELR